MDLMEEESEDDADDLLEDLLLLNDNVASGADWALWGGDDKGVNWGLGGEEFGVKAGEAVWEVGGVLLADPAGDLNEFYYMHLKVWVAFT